MNARQHCATTGTGHGIAHLSQHARLESALLEELDRDLAGDDSYALRIGGLKELSKESLLIGGQVQVRTGYGNQSISI